jgi:predicted MFS family arabinose efflux permease
VLAVAFLIGLCQALFEASAQPFLADLVPRDRLVSANARLSLTEGLAEIVGPATAGIMIATVGATGALTIDAATFGLSAVAILLVGRVLESYSTAAKPMGAAIGEGLRTVWRDDRLRSLTLLQGGANLASGVIAGLAVLFLQITLGLEGWQAGVVYAVNGAGGVAASLVSARSVQRVGLGRTIVGGWLVAALGFLLVAVTSTSTWPITATLGMGLVGLGVVTAIIAGATLRQHIVETEMLGRVTTSYRTVVNGAIAVGALSGGVVGEWVGVREALVGGAAIYILVGMSALSSPLNRPESAAPFSANP